MIPTNNNTSKIATTIDLVRHGEVSTPGLFCASADEPLSDIGWSQLKALAPTDSDTNKLPWHRIICSPQRRCREFAEGFAQQHAIPLNIEPNWREMNFGDWTGMRYESVWDGDRDRLMQLWSNPLSFTPPGADGESMLDFIERIETAWLTLRSSYQGQNILLLTHAGVIRSVLAHTLSMDYQLTQKLHIAYGRVNRVRCYADGETSLLNLACPAQHLTP